jgi:hypothetical protein
VPSFLLNDPDFVVGADPSHGLFGEVDEDEPNIPDSAVLKKSSATPQQRRRQEEVREQRQVHGDVDVTFMADAIQQIRTGVSNRKLNRAPLTYMELPEASRVFDGLLYNVLKMVIKGIKAALLNCVKNPSYVQAMCVLMHRMEMSRFERISQALSGLDYIQWKGDARTYQVDVMNAVREIRACQANMTHLILSRIVKSFEGKSKTVQYKVAEIINSGVDIDETLNLYDIIHSICYDIATVGDTKQSVNSIVDEEKCDFCGHKHKTADC